MCRASFNDIDRRLEIAQEDPDDTRALIGLMKIHFELSMIRMNEPNIDIPMTIEYLRVSLAVVQRMRKAGRNGHADIAAMAVKRGRGELVRIAATKMPATEKAAAIAKMDGWMSRLEKLAPAKPARQSGERN